jgi:predicted CoA-binding protein
MLNRAISFSNIENPILDRDPVNDFVPSDPKLKEILKNARVIAVVGLSDNMSRPSYRVAKFLLGRGYSVIPVNPKYETVLGLRSYPSLLEVSEDIDIVDIFRRSEAVDEIVDEAIQKGAKVIWMQEGIINENAAETAKEAGLEVIMDRCIYKTYSRLFFGKYEDL